MEDGSPERLKLWWWSAEKVCPDRRPRRRGCGAPSPVPIPNLLRVPPGWCPSLRLCWTNPRPILQPADSAAGRWHRQDRWRWSVTIELNGIVVNITSSGSWMDWKSLMDEVDGWNMWTDELIESMGGRIQWTDEMYKMDEMDASNGPMMWMDERGGWNGRMKWMHQMDGWNGLMKWTKRMKWMD